MLIGMAGLNILKKVSLIRHFQLLQEDSQTTITAHILQPVSPPNEMSQTHTREGDAQAKTPIMNHAGKDATA